VANGDGCKQGRTVDEGLYGIAKIGKSLDLGIAKSMPSLEVVVEQEYLYPA
jgi:hypothetical protein